MGNTKVELVKDLAEKLKQKLPTEQANAIAEIMMRAESGYYHDFDATIAAPKIQLHMDLLAVSLDDIDKKMQNGDYDDEPPTKEQEEEMFEQIKGTPLEKVFGDLKKKGVKN